MCLLLFAASVAVIAVIALFASSSAPGADGYEGVAYHGFNRKTFALTVSENGVDSSEIISAEDAAGLYYPEESELIVLLAGGNYISASYSATDNTVTFYAYVQTGTWLGIGYGFSMLNTD